MRNTKPTLHLLCGKMAAGKSTLARELAAAPDTVLVSEDHWLSHLYADQLHTLEDYVRCSGRLRQAMDQHLRSLLAAGLTVVLDFQANTVGSRRWMRRLLDEVDADHRLHFLDLPDETCKARLLARNDAGEHEFAPSLDDFDRFTAYFEPPSPMEGFHVVVHRPEPVKPNRRRTAARGR